MPVVVGGGTLHATRKSPRTHGRAGSPTPRTAGLGYHVDDITVISGQNLQAGAVLGRITASGLFTALNPGAADGSQNAAGILVPATNATAGNTASRALLRGPAMVNRNDIVFGGTVTAPQQATAVTALLALGIKAV